MGGFIENSKQMINIFTDGWLVSTESDHFSSFSELSNEEKLERFMHMARNMGHKIKNKMVVALFFYSQINLSVFTYDH